MPWWMSAWAQVIGWTLFYALAAWGVSAIPILLEPRLDDWGLHDVASWGRFLIPLVLAFLFGVRLRAWWWMFGPPGAIVVMMLTYPIVSFLTSSPPVRQETGTGLILAIILTVIDAGGTMLGAAAGVLCGKIEID